MKDVVASALAIAATCLLAPQPLTAAQLYRWVDDKGNVEWRDTPPPPTAKHVEQRTVRGNTIETSALPYALKLAIRNHPVTLWTFDCGEPCTQAARHLSRRGIPHTVRNSQTEPEALLKASGGREVPVLLVGSQKITGYLEDAWNTALDSAGYPRTPEPGVKKP